MQLFLVFAAVLAFMYLVLLRPQQQRLRRQQALVQAVTTGDYVVLQSGIVGRVVDETPERLHLEIADGVLVEVLKAAVFRKMEASELAFGLGAGADEDGGEEVGAETDTEEFEEDLEATDVDTDGEAGESGGGGDDEWETSGGEAADAGGEEMTAADEADQAGAAVTAPEQDTH